MPREQTERQCGDALHAAQRQDGVGAAQVHGVQDAGIDALARYRRRTGDDVAHARDLRRRDAHDRGGDVRVAAARHVASGRIDGDQALAGD